MIKQLDLKFLASWVKLPQIKQTWKQQLFKHLELQIANHPYSYLFFIEYPSYNEQPFKIKKQLNKLFNQLKKNQFYKSAIIIISSTFNSANVSFKKGAHTIPLYSSLFVVKMPGEFPSTSYETTPIQQLFADVIENIVEKNIDVRPSAPFYYSENHRLYTKMSKHYFDTLKSKPTT